MAGILAKILTVVFYVGYYQNICVFACELVESNEESSCLKLTATPYITTQSSRFGPTIEGASVNVKGEIFAVDYGDSKTTYQLGQVFSQQKLFYSDANKASYFNAIRFLNSNTAFVADAENHRVVKLTVGAGNIVSNSTNYCSDKRMIQPNDITLSKTGTVFTSGMKWIPNTDNTSGDIWSCLPNGTVKRLEVLGRTNGIDLSPDEKYLYVSESHNRNGVPIVQKIWKYSADVTKGTIANKKLFADFGSIDGTAAFDIDGMKTDMHGHLFVARYGGGHVSILSNEGTLIGKISLSFPNPTNLEFGGKNGKTLFIVGQCKVTGKGCVDRIDVCTPGRSWSILQNRRTSSYIRRVEL